MPKRGLDVSSCEIFRFYKLITTKSLIEPVSMIVPRRVSVVGLSQGDNHLEEHRPLGVRIPETSPYCGSPSQGECEPLGPAILSLVPRLPLSCPRTFVLWPGLLTAEFGRERLQASTLTVPFLL